MYSKYYEYIKTNYIFGTENGRSINYLGAPNLFVYLNEKNRIVSVPLLHFSSNKIKGATTRLCGALSSTL